MSRDVDDRFDEGNYSDFENSFESDKEDVHDINTAAPKRTRRHRANFKKSPVRVRSNQTARKKTDWKQQAWENLYQKSPSNQLNPARKSTSLKKSKSSNNRSMNHWKISKKVVKVSRERIDNLSKPKEIIPPENWSYLRWLKQNVPCTCKSNKAKKLCTLSAPHMNCARSRYTYARRDDAKHCTFKPKIKSSKNGGESSDTSEKSITQCIIRMEAKERSRRIDREREYGRQDYEAKLDKKVCPECGVIQKYEEVLDKKKFCMECNVEYRAEKTWTDVEAGFLSRLNSAENRKAERLKRIHDHVKEAMSPQKRAIFDKTKIEIRWERPNTPRWRDVRQSFFKRLDEDEVLRNTKTTELLRKREEMRFTFQPHLTHNDKYKTTESFEERMRKDLNNRENRIELLRAKWIDNYEEEVMDHNTRTSRLSHDNPAQNYNSESKFDY